MTPIFFLGTSARGRGGGMDGAEWTGRRGEKSRLAVESGGGMNKRHQRLQGVNERAETDHRARNYKRGETKR